MLVCGTNLPIKLTFDEDVSTFQELYVRIYRNDGASSQPIKSWRLQDCIIEDNVVYCPIRQKDFMADKLRITEDLNITIEIKWLREDDTEYNTATLMDYISYRKDTTVLS